MGWAVKIFWWLIKRWVYVLLTAGIILYSGWIYKQGIDHRVNQDIKRLEEIKKNREKIDEKLDRRDDAGVRSELCKWVPKSEPQCS